MDFEATQVLRRPAVGAQRRVVARDDQRRVLRAQLEQAALGGALVSAGGHKGWGLGLMVEMLAAGLTGGVNSVNVKPLKAPDGPPHDLGQFFILIDAAVSPDFAERFSTLAGAVAEDAGARLPGAGKKPAVETEVPEALWAMVEGLAQGPA